MALRGVMANHDLGAQERIAELEREGAGGSSETGEDETDESSAEDATENTTNETVFTPLKLDANRLVGDQKKILEIADFMSDVLSIQLTSPKRWACGADNSGDQDKTRLLFSVDWDKLGDWCGLGLAKTGAGWQAVELSGIDANRVVDVEVGFFSQSTGNEVLFFLMDDGLI